MMKTGIHYLLLSLLVVFASCGGGGEGKDERTKENSLPILVQQIRLTSRLYTTEYQVHKIITHDDDIRLKGNFLDKKYDVALPMTSRKIAIPVNVDLRGYVDFWQFSEKDVRIDGDKVEIILPDPKVELLGSKVEYDKIRKKVAFMRSDFTSEEMFRFEEQGVESVKKSIVRLGIIEDARKNAANILIPLISRLGYKKENITITFRKKFTDKDVDSIYVGEVGKRQKWVESRNMNY